MKDNYTHPELVENVPGFLRAKIWGALHGLPYTANSLRVVVRVRVFLLSPLLSRVCRMLGIEKINKYPARVTDYQFLYVINLRISNLLVPIKIIYTLALFH